MLDTEFSDQQMSATKTMSGPQIISTVNQWSDYWFFMSCTITNNWHNSTVSNVWIHRTNVHCWTLKTLCGLAEQMYTVESLKPCVDSKNKCTLLNP